MTGKIRENIKVLHIGTEISPSSAPLRIHNAVKQAGIDSKLLVLRKKVENDDIVVIKRTLATKIQIKLVNKGRQKKLSHYEMENAPFSFGDVGNKIYTHDLVKEADILHLHWINGDYLSYKEIGRLVAMGKPIVWTFHDSWPMTGGCHVRYGCEKFKAECGCCPLLDSKNVNDITHDIWREKEKYYNAEHITVVAPSGWMLSNVKQSKLFSSSRTVQIGNPLDFDVFCSQRHAVDNKEKQIKILFGANGALELKYKGYAYFVKAMRHIKITYPEIADRIVIYIFGTDIKNYEGLGDFPCEALGFIHSEKEMAEVYSMADIYVFPSIDDNLPGTVMESLACETPVVAFETGGVPEMVKHKKNGYVARYKDYQDLAEGIAWVCENNANNVLGRAGRKHIEEEYAMERIAAQYIGLYENLMEKSYE